MIWRGSGVSSTVINNTQTTFEEKLETSIEGSTSRALAHIHDLPISFCGVFGRVLIYLSFNINIFRGESLSNRQKKIHKNERNLE